MLSLNICNISKTVNIITVQHFKDPTVRKLEKRCR